MKVLWWRVVSWILLGAFLMAAALNMLEISAGFATNHLADIVGPAWLYVAFRGLGDKRRQTRLGQLVGATPERAALLLFLGSTATEVSQAFWPHGVFTGFFDPWDIAAYASGIAPLYLIDRFTPGTDNTSVARSSKPAA